MRRPKLNALKVFDAAARHLNFRAAAEELNVTQGAVAQTIRMLESDLGVIFFKRLARGVALTELGAKYHLGVSQGLATIDSATESLFEKTRAVTVSVPPSFASKWLVPRLPYFLETNPGVEVTTIASEALADFQTQDIDVAVRQGARPSGHDLHSVLLAPMRLCIVGSPAIATTKDIAGINVFANGRLIQDGHRHWERLFTDQGIEMTGSLLQFNQSALAMDAAANGQGYAVVPRLLASDDLASNRLVEVWEDQQETQNGFWIVYPKSHRSNKDALTTFVDWMISAVSEG